MFFRFFESLSSEVVVDVVAVVVLVILKVVLNVLVFFAFERNQQLGKSKNYMGCLFTFFCKLIL